MSHLKRQAPAVITYATKFTTKMKPNFSTLTKSRSMNLILVPRGHAPFGQHTSVHTQIMMMMTQQYICFHFRVMDLFS